MEVDDESVSLYIENIKRIEMTRGEFEQLMEAMMTKIEVGGRYTSVNGREWECIAVRGGNAWMVGDYGDGITGPAYMFNLDGTHICLNSSYNIKFEPVVEWVEYELNYDPKGCASFYDGHDLEGTNLTIRFPVIDGTPDFSQAKVTPA